MTTSKVPADEAVREDPPWPMLYIVDHTRYYSQEMIDKCGGRITDTFLFDCRTGVRCCEARLSYEMEYFTSDPGELPDDDELREEVHDALATCNAANQEPFVYYLIEGRLKELSQADEVPTSWDYKTLPFVLSLEEPDAGKWKEYLDDEDGDVRVAHRKYMEDVMERIRGNAPY